MLNLVKRFASNKFYNLFEQALEHGLHLDTQFLLLHFSLGIFGMGLVLFFEMFFLELNHQLRVRLNLELFKKLVI